MLTLTIDTAHELTSVGIIEGKKIITEQSWTSAVSETEKLVAGIMKLLKNAKYTLKDLDRVIVCEGPGPFSGVRCGVTTAVTLAYALGIALYGVDAGTMWNERSKEAEDAVVLINAGGIFVVHLEGNSQPEPENFELIIDKLKGKKTAFTLMGNLSKTQHALLKKNAPKNWKWIEQYDLKSFANICAHLPNKLLHKAKNGIVIPRYWRPPNITMPIHVSRS